MARVRRRKWGVLRWLPEPLRPPVRNTRSPVTRPPQVGEVGPPFRLLSSPEQGSSLGWNSAILRSYPLGRKQSCPRGKMLSLPRMTGLATAETEKPGASPGIPCACYTGWSGFCLTRFLLPCRPELRRSGVALLGGETARNGWNLAGPGLLPNSNLRM